MEERYHATTLNRFYPHMSNVNKNITVEAKLICPPTYISLSHIPSWRASEKRFGFTSKLVNMIQITSTKYLYTWSYLQILRHLYSMELSVTRLSTMHLFTKELSVSTPRHRFFLVSLCLKANAEMVPKIPSCHYMLLM